MSVRSESKEALHLKAEQIREQQRTRDDLNDLRQRGLFAKRDKNQVSTRRLAIADHLDDMIYGNPPPPPPRRGHTPLANNIKTVEPAKIDDSARSLISEMTLDASAKTEIDASGRSLGAAGRTEPSSNAVKKTSKPKSPVRTRKSPKTKSRKTRSNSIDSDAGSVLSTMSDLSAISEKRSKKKKHGSSRSVCSKASKKSTKKKTKKKTSGKTRRRASMKSVASCESIDELTVTSGEMSFEGLTLDSSTARDETDSHDAPASARSVATHDETGKAQREKKTKAKRRSSTGALSTTKKKSSKKKQSEDSKNESVPIVIGSGCDDDDDEDGKEPSLVESTLSGGDANGAEALESAVLSQGLQALADYHE